MHIKLIREIKDTLQLTEMPVIRNLLLHDLLREATGWNVPYMLCEAIARETLACEEACSGP